MPNTPTLPTTTTTNNKKREILSEFLYVKSPISRSASAVVSSSRKDTVRLLVRAPVLDLAQVESSEPPKMNHMGLSASLISTLMGNYKIP